MLNCRWTERVFWRFRASDECSVLSFIFFLYLLFLMFYLLSLVFELLSLSRRTCCSVNTHVV